MNTEFIKFKCIIFKETIYFHVKAGVTKIARTLLLSKPISALYYLWRLCMAGFIVWAMIYPSEKQE